MNQPLKLLQPRFVTKDEALTLHRASLDMYGGTDGVLNEGMLESALAQPRQQFGGEYAHAFPFGMAAAYGYHLAMNHALRDGNKRTAFATMVVFLRMNGWDFMLPDGHAAAMMLELIEQHRDKAWLAGRLADASRARASLELREFFAQITERELRTSLESMSISVRSVEYLASIEDVGSAMPILGPLHRLAAEPSLSERMAGYFAGQVALLRTIHQAAEDLGYEW